MAFLVLWVLLMGFVAVGIYVIMLLHLPKMVTSGMCALYFTIIIIVGDKLDKCGKRSQHHATTEQETSSV